MIPETESEDNMIPETESKDEEVTSSSDVFPIDPDLLKALSPDRTHDNPDSTTSTCVRQPQDKNGVIVIIKVLDVHVSSEKTEKLLWHLETCHKDEEAVIEVCHDKDAVTEACHDEDLVIKACHDEEAVIEACHKDEDAVFKACHDEDAVIEACHKDEDAVIEECNDEDAAIEARQND